LSEQEPTLGLKPLPRIGQEFGHFIIEKELPRGGQARVYRAWQSDLQRPVALKLLPASVADTSNSEALMRFRREIENIAQIDHPNIVRVYEAGELEGFPYFTMEYIEGRDTEAITRSGPMGPDEAAAIIEATARAMAEAHKRGIVHRDIKPGNIIVRNDGRPVLMDFGLAQNLTRSEQLTQTGVSMGTPSYMAPEQARGERNRVGIRSDIYALGATLFTLITGKRPVEGENTYELMLKVAESTGPRWPRQAIEDVPPDLRAIVEMAMKPDPLKRYESADAMAEDLERYLHGDWVVARSRGPLSRAWFRARRYVPVAAVLLIALGLAGGMVYTGLNPRDVVNRDGALLEERRWFVEVTQADDHDVETLFGEDGAWTRIGATVQRGGGGEIVLQRTGESPLMISPRDPTCWGDFTLQCNFRVREVPGPLVFRVGMPDDYTEVETAYAITLGAGARDRFELKRLGVPVLSGYRTERLSLVESDTWYRMEILRRAQTLSFALYQAGMDTPIVSFGYEDDFPALVSGRAGDPAYGRQRFAVVADVPELHLRDVTVSHRDGVYPTEALLFSVGHYAEAELRASARLAPALPADADNAARNERAGLFFLRARCREQLGKLDDAYDDLSAAKRLAEDDALRARLFLASSRIETLRENDTAALAQLRVARNNSSTLTGLTSMLYHDAHARARALEDFAPERAMLYYDFVADGALGSPGLIADSLFRSACIRLDVGMAHPPLNEVLVPEALVLLERLDSSSYRRFGGVFVPAMARLFEQRLQDAHVNPAPALDTARALADGADSYGADRSLLHKPLVSAAWLARMLGDAAEPDLTLEAVAWLALPEGDKAADVLLMFQRNLMAEERPEAISREERIEMWQELAASLTVDEPAQGLLAVVADYFIGGALGENDRQRREELLRRAVRRDFEHVPAFWFGDMGPNAFVDYCIALAVAESDHSRATALLETAASTPEAGVLVHLAGRAERWLPLPR
jgi:predicted Ser/Thr protein kinase